MSLIHDMDLQKTTPSVACVAGATLKNNLSGQIGDFVGPNLAVGPNSFHQSYAEMA